MSRKLFTKEEMDEIKKSIYVIDVSPSIVHFTAEFKQLLWEKISNGIKVHDAVEELGLNPELLGKTRVDGLKGMIRNELRDGKGFRDLKTYEKYQDDFVKPEGRIRYLEQQLLYKDQEIEFLKKIVSLGNGKV